MTFLQYKDPGNSHHFGFLVAKDNWWAVSWLKNHTARKEHNEEYWIKRHESGADDYFEGFILRLEK